MPRDIFSRSVILYFLLYVVDFLYSPIFYLVVTNPFAIYRDSLFVLDPQLFCLQLRYALIFLSQSLHYAHIVSSLLCF